MLHRKQSLRASYAEKARNSRQTGKTSPRPAIARQKGIRRVSDKRAAQNRLYATRRREYMDAHPRCENDCGRPPEQLHHRRGRNAGLLIDARYFCALCNVCHDRVHAEPSWARANGLLSSASDWNTVDRKNAYA